MPQAAASMSAMPLPTASAARDESSTSFVGGFVSAIAAHFGPKRHLTAAADAVSGVLDCMQLVPSPFDTSPIRSPQAVHSLIARHVAGKNLVEIGTRTGDGLQCYAQVAQAATAIETDPSYCEFLRARERQLPRGNYTVHCESGTTAAGLARMGSAEVITWWEPPPIMDMLTLLQQNAPLLRPDAEAITLFDLSFHADQVCFAFIRSFAAWVDFVDYDECDGCVAAYRRGHFTEAGVNCARAVGTFAVMGFKVHSLPGTMSQIRSCAQPMLKLAKHKGLEDALATMREPSKGKAPKGYSPECSAMTINAMKAWKQNYERAKPRHRTVLREQCAARQSAACSEPAGPSAPRCGKLSSNEKRKNETTAYDDDNDADHDDPNHQVESTLVKAFAQSARDKRRVMIIDVGANNGQWFKQMLKLTALITTDYGTFRLDCHGSLNQVCGPKGCSSSCFVRRRAASRRPTCSSRRRSSFPR